MNGTVHGPAAAARPRGAAAGHLMTGVVLPLVTAAVALAGLRVQVPGGVSPLDEVAVGVVLIWALAGAVCARAPGRAPLWPLAGGTLAAAVALTAARLASQPPAGQHQLARAVATLAAALVIAASCHFLLALPDGRLGGQARRTGAAIAYLGALGTGLVFALAGRHCRPWSRCWGWRRPSAVPCPPCGCVTSTPPPPAGNGCNGSPSAWWWPWTRP